MRTETIAGRTWEIFEPPRARHDLPSVSLCKSCLSINGSAYAVTGAPAAYRYVFDPHERVIGLVPTTRADPDAWPVTRNGRGVQCAIGSLLQRMGIPLSGTRQYYEATWDGERLVFGPIGGAPAEAEP